MGYGGPHAIIFIVINKPFDFTMCASFILLPKFFFSFIYIYILNINDCFWDILIRTPQVHKDAIHSLLNLRSPDVTVF